jgi:hypothetical protein
MCTKLYLQSVMEASDFHGHYHISAEFARALREAAKQLLREEKLPALAAAADRELWLTWVDSLIGGSNWKEGVTQGLGGRGMAAGRQWGGAGWCEGCGAPFRCGGAQSLGIDRQASDCILLTGGRGTRLGFACATFLMPCGVCVCVCVCV